MIAPFLLFFCYTDFILISAQKNKTRGIIMFDKNSNQIQHNGNGNVYIDQSKNYFTGYGDKNDSSSTNSSNEFYIIAGVLIISAIMLSFTSTTLDFTKSHIIFLIGFQIILLVSVNLFVYLKSKNIKSLLTELIPSIFTPISTVHAISRTPDQIQQFLNQVQVPFDKNNIGNFIGTAIQNFFNVINQQDNQWLPPLTLIYTVIVILLVISPVLISYNTYFKKSVKNTASIFIIIFYWIFVFANTLL